MERTGITRIVGLSLFDGSDTLASDVSVELCGERISRVSSMADRSQSAANVVIDGRGLTAVPGLINLHVHLCLDINWAGDRTDPSTPLLPTTEGDLVARMLENAKETLEGGITTVRDLGAPGGSIFLVRRLIEGNLAIGPHISASGPMITRTGGHGWFMGEEADGVSEIQKAVRRRLKSGADVVKLMVTGGYLTKGTSPSQLAFSPQEIRGAVAEARRANVQTTVHAAGAAGIEAALRGGVDCIEHGAAMTPELAARVVDQGTIWVPTVGVAVSAQAPENQEIIQRRQSHHDQGVRSVRRNGGKLDDERRLKSKLDTFRRLCHLDGLQLGIGDDAGTLFAMHGNLLPEMEAFADAGFSNAEILRMATSGNAGILQIQHVTGTIQAGLLGDIVLVDGDPLSDLRSIRRVAMVLKEGRVRFVRNRDRRRIHEGDAFDADD